MISLGRVCLTFLGYPHIFSRFSSFLPNSRNVHQEAEVPNMLFAFINIQLWQISEKWRLYLPSFIITAEIRYNRTSTALGLKLTPLQLWPNLITHDLFTLLYSTLYIPLEKIKTLMKRMFFRGKKIFRTFFYLAFRTVNIF